MKKVAQLIKATEWKKIYDMFSIKHEFIFSNEKLSVSLLYSKF